MNSMFLCFVPLLGFVSSSPLPEVEEINIAEKSKSEVKHVAYPLPEPQESVKFDYHGVYSGKMVMLVIAGSTIYPAIGLSEAICLMM